MAKLARPAIAGRFRGRVGEVVFKIYGDKTVITAVPVFDKPPTEKQKAQRKRFGDATLWAKDALSDPQIREVYTDAASRLGRNAVNLAVADHLRPPEITGVDLTRYDGQVGDVILIQAANIVHVARVVVSVTDDGTGQAIERGLARVSPGSTGGGVWTYELTQTGARNTTRVEVTVEDAAGNRVEERVW